jgi:hypothetical protein
MQIQDRQAATLMKWDNGGFDSLYGSKRGDNKVSTAEIAKASGFIIEEYEANIPEIMDPAIEQFKDDLHRAGLRWNSITQDVIKR